MISARMSTCKADFFLKYKKGQLKWIIPGGGMFQVMLAAECVCTVCNHSPECQNQCCKPQQRRLSLHSFLFHSLFFFCGFLDPAEAHSSMGTGRWWSPSHANGPVCDNGRGLPVLHTQTNLLSSQLINYWWTFYFVYLSLSGNHLFYSKFIKILKKL